MNPILTRSQTDLLRQKIIAEYVTPFVERVFKQYPKINSCTFSVAQYFDDEARDQVYDAIYCSVLNDFDGEASEQAAWYNKRDEVNLPDFKKGTSPLTFMKDIDSQIEKERGISNEYYWRAMIPAFAAFCQESPSFERNYAVLRRKNEAIEVEIIGKMIRPWLDGIELERGWFW